MQYRCSEMRKTSARDHIAVTLYGTLALHVPVHMHAHRATRSQIRSESACVVGNDNGRRH